MNLVELVLIIGVIVIAVMVWLLPVIAVRFGIVIVNILKGKDKDK